MKIFILLVTLMSCTSNNPHWGIQLQNYKPPYDLQRIAKSSQDLWVIDADEVSKSDVTLLKDSGKKMISYLSIGEAESYRGYFKGLDKKVLLKENPEWKGNFTVKYWEPAWESAIMDSLDIIIHKGFDGVFLDIIDAFDRFPDKEVKAQQMADFVIRIRNRAPKDFIIIPQNGVHIRRHLKDPSKYLTAINGVNVENAINETSVVEDIRFYQNADKFVLSLEYPETDEEIKKYFNLARSLKVSPLAAEKSLTGKLTFPEEK